MLTRFLGWHGRAGQVLFAIQARTGIANTAGVATVFGYLALSAGRAGLASSSERISLVGAGAYIVAAGLFGPLVEGRAFAPVRVWLDSGGSPSPAQRRALLAQPLWQAGLNFAYWIVAAVVLGIVSASVIGGSAGDVSRVITSIVMGGLISFGLAYLLVERRLRPLFAVALSDPTASDATVIGARRLGIRPRLLLAWALGSGIALLGIVVEPLSHIPGRSLPVNHPAFYLAVVGLFAGVVLILVAASAVSDPLRELETSMKKAAAGNLAVAVPVDDPGELGVLQSGFNVMIRGLRERELLDDLFGRHVGLEVAREALKRGATLDGELRDISALFIDLIGSTRLARLKPPTEVVADLNTLFEAVVVVMKLEGGWVNKFVGDAALCVFGAPGDQPDHAARALRAARALQAEMVHLSQHHPDLDAGIGVSSGLVLAGNVGAEERYEYTVIGDAVNEAARLTDLAKGHPRRVLASEAVIRAAEDAADGWRLDGEAVLRGREVATPFYTPL